MKKKKQKKLTKLERIKNIIVTSFTRFTHLYAFVGMLAYLLIFQHAFVFTGDSWAETFYEYVHGAVTGGWQAFFQVGIAGYFNFLPKLFSFSYILLGAPLEYVDYFCRIVVIVYTLACISFIAHPYNRHLVKNDGLRLLLAIATLLTFYHISSFSFINVWYVGFIPIILVSLHPQKFIHEWQQVLYAAFAMSVCLTKPSLILLPLVVYRMIRHKEFLLGSIILFSIGLQTLLFFASAYYEQWVGVYNEHVSIFQKIKNTLLYPGLLLLKLYQLQPFHVAAVVGATGILGILFAALIKIRGVIQTLLIGLTLSLVSYTAIYPPDTPPFSVTATYATLFSDEMKLQRELLISFIIILVLFTVCSFVFEWHKLRRYSRWVKSGVVVLLVVLTAISFRPIDVQSSKLHVNIDPFRSSLAKNSAICMPIPPTPSWYPDDTAVYGWYYESYGIGTCGKTNYDKQIDYSSFDKLKLSKGRSLTTINTHHHLIKSLYLPVYNPNPHQATTLVLTNKQTGKIFTAPIESKTTNDHLTFVAFNLDGERNQPEYQYELSEQNNPSSKLSIGSFTDKKVAKYEYFLPPNLKHPKDKD